MVRSLSNEQAILNPGCSTPYARSLIAYGFGYDNCRVYLSVLQAADHDGEELKFIAAKQCGPFLEVRGEPIRLLLVQWSFPEE